MTRLRPGDTPADGGQPDTVSLDEDGYYRLGARAWPLVSRTLLPAGRLHLFAGSRHAAQGLAAPPASGQGVFAGMGALMWLVDGDLVCRPVYDDSDPNVNPYLVDGLLLDGIGYVDVEEEPSHRATTRSSPPPPCSYRR